jgi:hypothetical protein
MSVVLSTNKSDFHEIAEIVLKVALNTKIVQSGNITHPLALQTKPFFEYSIIKCRVDIDNMLTFPVAIFVYKLYL